MESFSDRCGEGDVGVLGGLGIDEGLPLMFFEGKPGIDESATEEITREKYREEE